MRLLPQKSPALLHYRQDTIKVTRNAPGNLRRETHFVSLIRFAFATLLFTNIMNHNQSRRRASVVEIARSHLHLHERLVSSIMLPSLAARFHPRAWLRNIF